MENRKTIFKIFKDLSYEKVIELSHCKELNFLCFLIIEEDERFYNSHFTYLSTKCLDQECRRTDLRYGNFTSRIARTLGSQTKFDSNNELYKSHKQNRIISYYQNPNVFITGIFREVHHSLNYSCYEMIIEDIDGDQRLEIFERNNVGYNVYNMIDPIINCLKRLKELDQFRTWLYYEKKQLEKELQRIKDNLEDLFKK